MSTNKNDYYHLGLTDDNRAEDKAKANHQLYDNTYSAE